MKNFFHIAAATVILTAGVNVPALAAGGTTTNTSTTNSALSAMTAANGGQQNITSNGAGSVRTVPNQAGNSFYSSFSQDNCMVSAGGGIVLLGFGANGVTPYRDTQCDKRMSFQRIMQAAAMEPAHAPQLQQAANDVLCALGGPVYEALKNQGLCSANAVKQAGDDPTKVSVAEPVAAVQAPPQPVAMNTAPATKQAQLKTMVPAGKNVLVNLPQAGDQGVEHYTITQYGAYRQGS
jgi:hypothetical protein